MKYFNKSFFRLAVGFLVIVALSLILIVATSAYAQVEITEVMYDPKGTDANSGGEWIELKILDEVADLTKWKISDKTGESGSFSSRTIAYFSGYEELSSGSFVIVAKSPEDFTSFFPSYSGSIFKSSFSLTEDDEIKILNPDGGIVDQLAYSSVFGAKNDGNSLQKFGSNWRASLPTPGSANSSESSSQFDSISVNQSFESVAALSGPALGPSVELEVLAGSDRTTAPGSPITFQAKIKKNTTKNSASLSWSFGDGNVGVGPLVTHTYKYPGEYAVVLNVVAGEVFAVSRLRVRVVEPSLKISDTPEYIEVENQGSQEINLFNWKITQGYNSFVFQPDTIVLPKSSIKVDKSLLKLKSSADPGLVLSDAGGRVVASLPKVLDVSETPLQKLALFEIMPTEPQKVYTQKDLEQKEQVLEPEKDLSIEAGETSQVIYEIPKKSGFFARTWQFFKAVLD